MKFTLSWLKDHLETEATLDEIVEALTMIGLEVEDVDDRSVFKPFVIAKVLTAEKHPDADKLQVLSVDTGDGNPIQVVCGAPNARAGLVGAFAGPGTYVPGIDFTLSVGNIRGVESHGMMCSERELEISDSHDGIIDLPEDAPIGTPFADYAGLNDPVIEIGITPNRPDALGVAGIARDLEAAGLGKVKTPEIAKPDGKGTCPVNVRLEFDGESLCPAFGLRHVSGVKNGPSPKWMQQRLKAIGLRPISALVDITNYMTFDRGRPLHVFDADKVKGDLVVRAAKQGEKFLALDGKEYEFSPDMCVIADDNGVESLSGIMGGEASGCTEETTNVLIESALWEPNNIARTGRDLGIHSDARYRFERGVDPAFMVSGLDMATSLVVELCGGEASEEIIAGEIPKAKQSIEFPFAETRRLTGIEIENSEATNILTRLGFEVSGSGDVVNVAIPSWRPDVFGKADLVEEIMRIHGVNRIEPQPLVAHQSVNSKILTTAQTRDRKACRSLASRGMLEAVTWSFISEADALHFGGGNRDLELANPISSEMVYMRPSLLPSLMRSAQKNADRGYPDVALFEVSHAFRDDSARGQLRIAAGIRRGTEKMAGSGRHWSGNGAAVDVFDARADAMAVLEACGMDASRLQIVGHGDNPSPDWYHPGRSGTIQMGPKMILARFGEIHPMTLEAMDVSGPMVAFEVFLDTIPEPKRKPTKTKPVLELSDLQPVCRDFAFVMDRDVSAATLLRAVQGVDRKLVSDVTIFDLFEGESLGEDKKSVAFEVSLQPADKSMTEEEIEAVSDKIIAAVSKSTGGTLRGGAK